MTKKHTATDEIIQFLAGRIISNKLRPNDKLPNERELAETFNVARGHVREALRGLATVGLIEIRSGQGSFVKDYDERMKSDAISWLFHLPHTSFTELFESRELVEKNIYFKAFDYCNKVGLDELKNSVLLLEKSSQVDVNSYADAIDAFDIKIAEITKNPLLIKLMQAMTFIRREAVERVLQVEGSIHNSLNHRKLICEAFISNDINKVTDAINLFYSESKKRLDSI